MVETHAVGTSDGTVLSDELEEVSEDMAKLSEELDRIERQAAADDIDIDIDYESTSIWSRGTATVTLRYEL